MVYLQVRGQNQLLREIEQTNMIERKIVDLNALHRNELTDEIEGQHSTEDIFNERKKQDMKIPNQNASNASKMNIQSGLISSHLSRDASVLSMGNTQVNGSSR